MILQMQVQIRKKKKKSGDKNLLNLDTKGRSVLRHRVDRSWDAIMPLKEKEIHKIVFCPDSLVKKQPPGITNYGCMFEVLR